MKTRTLMVLALIVVLLAAGALVVRGQGHSSISQWFISLHGGH